MITLDRDSVTETFRAKLLKALDDAAKETFATVVAAHSAGVGATDGDLPRLFTPLDVQIDTLAARYGVRLVDEAEPEHHLLPEWREAVAEGHTTDGFDDWFWPKLRPNVA